MSDKLLRGVLFDRAARFTAISAKDMVEKAMDNSPNGQ